MANKENLPPRLATPPISRISPSNKPALGRQRDHSACRAADSPLKVKKTRENLKQASAYAEVPPPCLHVPHIHHDHRLCTPPEGTASGNYAHPSLPLDQASGVTSPQPQSLPEQPEPQSLHVQSKAQRQKSVSQRMLSRVKQGIASRSKSSQSIRPTGSETSPARRLSGRRKPSSDADRRSQSFELSRDSIESTIDDVSGVSAGVPPQVQRSFTDSTVSTSEISEDLASVQVPSFQTDGYFGPFTEPNLSTSQTFSSPAPSSPSLQPTPRPLRKSIAHDAARSHDKISVVVPCVDLKVTVDSTSVDVSSKRDVWIAIDATVRLKTTKLSGPAVYFDRNEDLLVESNVPAPVLGLHEVEGRHKARYDCGAITNLRLCYKPAQGCRVRNIIGQKSYKDLTVGQQCTLFIKLGIPRMQTADDRMEPDQESLFAEIESMVGTLETDILHIEARYRHSMFPSDNVVALKHTCKLLRPKTESRWSIIGLYEKEDASSDVHVRLAQYLADHYAADEALELLHRYFDYDTRARPGMAEICSMLQDKINLQRNGLDDQQPEVVITDIDLNAGNALDPVIEHYDTAPSTPLESKTTTRTTVSAHKRISSASSIVSSKLAPPLISAPRTTTAITTPTTTSSPPPASGDHESHDSAHQLWRHIRRTSLSARQLEEMTPQRLSHLEAGDDSLKELRRRAIANKRSIGAETLRNWKWEEDMQAKERPAEAPWM